MFRRECRDMYRVGICTLEENQWLKAYQALKSADLELVLITKFEQLSELDGFVLDIGSEELFQPICEWLVNAQKYSQLLVWIRSSIELRKGVYLQLGVDGFILEEDGGDSLLLMIQNAFNRIEQSQTKKAVMEEVTQIRLDNVSRSIWLPGEQEVLLTKQEYKIVALLYAQANTVVPYQSINQQLWHEDLEDSFYRVANIIFHLRSKLGKENKKIIQTVRSVGYKLVM